MCVLLAAHMCSFMQVVTGSGTCVTTSTARPRAKLWGQVSHGSLHLCALLMKEESGARGRPGRIMVALFFK